MDTTAVILAAGKSTRFSRDGKNIPNALRELRGRPFIDYILKSLDFLPPANIVTVVGFGKERLMEVIGGRSRFAEQTEQLGTGHATACAAPLLKDCEAVLVCYVDMPLLRRDTMLALLEKHRAEGNACTLLTGTVPGAQTLGRVLRTPDGGFDRIVEFKDADETQRAVTEYNAGTCCFQADKLLAAFPRLRNANAAGEYYLTDVPALLKEDGGRIGIFYTQTPGEIMGANTPEELAEMEKYL